MESNTQISKPPEQPASPRWSWTAKLIFGLIIAAIALLLVVRFQNFVGPLLTSFIIAYLFNPLASFLNKRLKINWRLSVLIIYLVILLIILGLVTWSGFSLVEQVQNLINFIQDNINKIPEFIDQLSTTDIKIGPLVIDLSKLKWENITTDIVSAIEPILGTAGSLVGKLISGGANMIFWFFITYLVSFFFLSESQGSQSSLMKLNIPGYEDDMNRMSKELSRIFSSFIRGEIVVVAIAIVIWSVYLGVMGVRFFIGLAVIAGLGRLIPYVGAWIGWISIGLVAVLQGSNHFGLLPGWYMVIVIGIAIIIDSIMDNFLVPKVMGNALKVPPAAILIAALIGADLLGLIGVILAAPVYACIQLIVRYIFAKMVDKDPWEGIEYREPRKQSAWILFITQQVKKFIAWIKRVFLKKKKPKPGAGNQNDTAGD